MNVSYSKAHRFVWFRVAKTGTRSLHSVLEQTLPDYTYLEGWKRSQHHDEVNALLRDGVFSFSMVRNPWERLVSAWLDKFKRTPKRGKYFDAQIRRCRKLDDTVDPQVVLSADFAWFIDRLIDSQLYRGEPHFMPQSDILANAEAEYLGRFENYLASVSEIFERLDIPMPSEFPHRNKTASPKRCYRDYYDRRTADVVADLYAMDIERYGYSFF